MRRKRHVLIACTGFCLGAVLTLIYFREPTVPFTREATEDARRVWTQGGIKSYAAAYRMNASLYEVTVRNDLVESVAVDGVTPNATNLQTYSVSGLFDLLELELSNLSDSKGPFGPSGSMIVARVRFHPQWGYPERFLRAGGGTGQNATIEMVRFEVLD